MVMPINSMGMGNSGNYYQSLKSKYGVPSDFRERPVIAGYPMEIVPRGTIKYLPRNTYKNIMLDLYG